MNESALLALPSSRVSRREIVKLARGNTATADFTIAIAEFGRSLAPRAFDAYRVYVTPRLHRRPAFSLAYEFTIDSFLIAKMICAILMTSAPSVLAYIYEPLAGYGEVAEHLAHINRSHSIVLRCARRRNIERVLPSRGGGTQRRFHR